MMGTIYLAGGCFWGMEKLFRALSGVTEALPGYANGDAAAHANYPDVCTGVTGFRETVRVDYDSARISPEALLFAFFAVVDTETPNRQGPDVGSQYQAGIYWTDAETGQAILRFAEKERSAAAVFAVELKPLENFFPAEEEHLRYLEKHPHGYCHIAPWRIAALAQQDLERLAKSPLPAREALAAQQQAMLGGPSYE